MILTLDEIREKVRPICEAYKVKRLFLFGSYARGEATKESDVDFHIMLDEETTLLELGGLYVDLEDALQKEVDIVTQVPKEQEIFGKYMEKEEILLYEDQRERCAGSAEYSQAL
jgi:hypothetical protein